MATPTADAHRHAGEQPDPPGRSPNDAVTVGLKVFYAKNIAGGANTVTTHFGLGIHSFALMYLHEYAGLDRTDPLDAQSVAASARRPPWTAAC